MALHNELSSFEQMTSADLIVQKLRNDYILIIIEQLLLRKKKLSHCYFDQFLLADFLGMYSICLSFVFLLPGYVELNRSLFESFFFKVPYLNIWLLSLHVCFDIVGTSYNLEVKLFTCFETIIFY